MVGFLAIVPFCIGSLLPHALSLLTFVQIVCLLYLFVMVLLFPGLHFNTCLIPKKNKDITSSSSYRPIALASSISILEHLILTKFSSYISSHKSSSPSTIVHCVAQIDTITAIVLHRFLSLLSSALSSLSSLVQSVFSVSSSFVYSFTGYNNVYGANHLIDYLYSDLSFAHIFILRFIFCSHDS